MKLIQKPQCILALISLVVFACGTAPDPAIDQLENMMDSYHHVGQFTGTVLVSHNNAIVFKKAYGEANREWHINNTIDTKFRLGSATKPFTAALVMKLAQAGLLRIDGTVSDYLPNFRADVGQKVTIHDLLTHSSGIIMPPMTLDEYWNYFQQHWTTSQLVDSLCSGDLAFEPGSRFSYSSAGFILLGAIIEQVKGNSYEAVLDEYILTPYNLDDTGFDYPENIIPHRALGYQTNFGLGNARYKYMPNSHASGALYSTVEDLYKWDQLLRQDEFLNTESKRKMYTPQIDSDRGPFGYGWFLDTVSIAGMTQNRVYHAGDVSGFCGMYVRVLETGDFVALLSNQEGLNYYDISNALLDILNGMTPPQPKEYLSDVLRFTYFKTGKQSMITRYQKISESSLNEFKVDMDEINELGYDLLAMGDNHSALEVFKMNAQLHPASANVFDSLAEGYLKLKEFENASLYYTKSLELDPHNDNAQKMLKSIQGRLKSAEK